eukprot:4914938-Alexandrium_andersonii.AAC.1
MGGEASGVAGATMEEGPGRPACRGVAGRYIAGGGLTGPGMGTEPGDNCNGGATGDIGNQGGYNR